MAAQEENRTCAESSQSSDRLLDSGTSGPYKATQLWFGVINDFREKMPTGNHWKHMRHYESSFTANEAVKWLRIYLKDHSEFSSNISKEQALHLLRKFYKAGVFEQLRGKQIHPDSLKNNSELFRMTSKTPLKVLRTPGRPPLVAKENTKTRDKNGTETPEGGKVTVKRAKSLFRPSRENEENEERARVQLDPNHLQECRLVARQLTTEEVQDTWKDLLLQKLQNLLRVKKVEDLVSCNILNGAWIEHNMTKVSQRGLTLPTNRADELPRWVLSAMRCLTKWPKRDEGERNLPSYPEFPSDVFELVIEYFIGLPEPLTTLSLYDTFAKAFIRAEYLDVAQRTIGPRNTPLRQVPRLHLHISPVSSSESVDNLGFGFSPCIGPCKTSTPETQVDHHQQRHSRGDVWKRALSLPSSTCTHGSLDILSDTRRHSSQMPPHSCLETVFVSDCPVTRIIPQRSVDSLHLHPSGHSLSNTWRPQSIAFGPMKSCHSMEGVLARPWSLAPQSTDESTYMPMRPGSIPSGPSSAPILSLTDDAENIYCLPLERHEKPASIRRRMIREDSLTNVHHVKKSKMSSPVLLNHMRSKSGGYINLALSPSSDAMGTSRSSSGIESDMKRSSHSSSWGSFSPGGIYENLGDVSRLLRHSDEDLYNPNLKPETGDHVKMVKAPSKRLLGRCKRLEHYYGAKACAPGMLTAEGKLRGIQVMQLLCLLLPPGHRRQLQILLRFMDKITNHSQLFLSNESDNRSLVLNTFSRSILRAKEDADHDELLSLRITTFLMENHEDVMRVPYTLLEQVRTKLQRMQSARIQYEVDDGTPITYCQQVPAVVFEVQKQVSSEQGLLTLLDGILQNEKFSTKERTKHLKKFRATYPDIYMKRFPDSEAREDSRCRLADLSKHQKRLPFPKLKNLRL